MGVWGWGQGLERLRNAGFWGVTTEPCGKHPQAPNTCIQAGAELLSIMSLRHGLGTLMGQSYETPAGDIWMPPHSSAAPTRALL